MKKEKKILKLEKELALITLNYGYDPQKIQKMMQFNKILDSINQLKKKKEFFVFAKVICVTKGKSK